MKTVERPTRTGALVRWNLSLAASLAVHGGLFVWLWVSIFSLAPRGGERPPGPELSAEKRPEAIPEPEEVPEAEAFLEVADLDEPVVVRPVAYEPEPLPPEVPLERVELLPPPTDDLQPQDLTPPRVEPEPPVEEPEPAPEPEPPVEEPDPPELVEETVGESDGDESAPAPLVGSCPDPVYPDRAVLRRLEGEVLCRITVGADGSVVGVTVVGSSGHGLLDRAARDGLLTWQFLPGSRDGIPVEMDVMKTIIFQLP